jgi:hypothetical protein
MTLYEKIITIYPQLNNTDFSPFIGTITLQNDGEGDYIKEWNNALPRPTEEQLNGVF